MFIFKNIKTNLSDTILLQICFFAGEEAELFFRKNVLPTFYTTCISSKKLIKNDHVKSRR